jgi:hypothetical protein
VILQTTQRISETEKRQSLSTLAIRDVVIRRMTGEVNSIGVRTGMTQDLEDQAVVGKM